MTIDFDPVLDQSPFAVDDSVITGFNPPHPQHTHHSNSRSYNDTVVNYIYSKPQEK